MKYNFLGDQELVYTDAMEFFANYENTSASLIGYAGTGKTYLVGCLADAIQRQIGRRVCIAAPTHQAKNELLNKVTLQGVAVDAHTSAGLIGLGPDESIDGFDPNRPEFFPRWESKVNQYDVILHDESSMLNKSYSEYLLQECVKHGVQVLFIGDDAQLPPVGDLSDSPCLNQEIKFILSKVIRQAADNPLAYLLLGMRIDIDHYRQRIISPDLIASFEELYYAKEDRIKIDMVPGTITKQLLKNIKEDYTEEGGWKTIDRSLIGEKYKEIAELIKSDGGYAGKVLAFTNVAVEEHARMVRKFLVPLKSEFIIPGDLLLGYRTIQDNNNQILIMNSRVYEVDTVTESNDIHGYDVFNIKTKDGIECTTLNPSNYTRYISEFKVRLDNAKKRKQWRAFWSFRNGYLLTDSLNTKLQNKTYPSKDLFYAYACTIHKSQGSTYNTVLVDVVNTKIIVKIEDSKLNFYRLLYVAASRASNMAYLIVN